MNLAQTITRVALITLMIVPSASRAQEAEAPDRLTTRDGVYTERQAQRGEKLSDDVCAECHLPDWYTGTFFLSWQGAPVSALYELIRTTMPLDRPGSLKRQQYADVLAYIFQLNGLPAGDRELRPRDDVLGRIIIR